MYPLRKLKINLEKKRIRNKDIRETPFLQNFIYFATFIFLLWNIFIPKNLKINIINWFFVLFKLLSFYYYYLFVILLLDTKLN